MKLANRLEYVLGHAHGFSQSSLRCVGRLELCFAQHLSVWLYASSGRVFAHQLHPNLSTTTALTAPIGVSGSQVDGMAKDSLDGTRGGHHGAVVCMCWVFLFSLLAIG